MSAATPQTATTVSQPRPRRPKARQGTASQRRLQGDKRSKQAPESADTHHEISEQDRNYAFSVAMKYVKDEHAAADIAQEALLLAHRHRHSFRGDSRYTTWLYRIAATTALMHLRKAKRRKREVLVAPTADADNQVVFERPSPRSRSTAGTCRSTSTRTS